MANSPITTVHVIVKGRVQGVGFRYFAQRTASEKGLKGWVRNRADGDVEAEATGPKNDLESWIEDLRRGPSLGRVDHLNVDWRPAAAEYGEFSIR